MRPYLAFETRSLFFLVSRSLSFFLARQSRPASLLGPPELVGTSPSQSTHSRFAPKIQLSHQWKNRSFLFSFLEETLVSRSLPRSSECQKWSKKLLTYQCHLFGTFSNEESWMSTENSANFFKHVSCCAWLREVSIREPALINFSSELLVIWSGTRRAKPLRQEWRRLRFLCKCTFFAYAHILKKMLLNMRGKVSQSSILFLQCRLSNVSASVSQENSCRNFPLFIVLSNASSSSR